MDDEIRRKIMEEIFQIHKIIHESPEDVWDQSIDLHIGNYQLLVKKVTPEQKQMLDEIVDMIFYRIKDLEKPGFPPTLESYAKIIAQT